LRRFDFGFWLFAWRTALGLLESNTFSQREKVRGSSAKRLTRADEGER